MWPKKKKKKKIFFLNLKTNLPSCPQIKAIQRDTWCHRSRNCNFRVKTARLFWKETPVLFETVTLKRNCILIHCKWLKYRLLSFEIWNEKQNPVASHATPGREVYLRRAETLLNVLGKHPNLKTPFDSGPAPGTAGLGQPFRPASWGMHCHLAALGGSTQPSSLGSSAQASEIPDPQVLCGPLGPYSAGRATSNQCLRVWTGMSLWSGPSLCETVLQHSCIAWHSGRKNAPSQRSDLSCWNDRKKGNTRVVSWCRDAAPLCLSGVMGPTKH